MDCEGRCCEALCTLRWFGSWFHAISGDRVDDGLWAKSVGLGHDEDAAADETDSERSLPEVLVTTIGLNNEP